MEPNREMFSVKLYKRSQLLTGCRTRFKYISKRILARFSGKNEWITKGIETDVALTTA